MDLDRLGAQLLPWQRDGAVALASGASRLLWWSAGLGKSLCYLSAADLLDVRHVLFVTRALGRNVFARDSVLLRRPRRIAVVVGEGPGTDGLTPSQLQAVKRTDKALQRYRDKGALCWASGSVQDAVKDGLSLRDDSWADAWAVVVTWETLSCHESEILKAGFDLCIFDEHHAGKHYKSKRTMAAHRIAQAVPVVWGGTATPVPDRVRDLWGQLYAVGGRVAWGTSLSWMKRYAHATPGRFGGWDSEGPHRLGCSYCARTTPELKRRLDWWADVKTRKLVADMLPPATRSMIHVPPGDDEEDSGTSSRPGTGIEAAVARAAGQKLRPVAACAVEALVAREKIVVVGNRRSWVPRMEKAIRAGMPTGMKRDGRVWIRAVSGEDDVSTRLEIAADFMALRTGSEEPYDAAVLVATVDSIRTSIDLHDADRVLNAALPWTPEAIEQLEGRFRRIGQKRRVQYDYFIAEGTIDESIEDVLLSKMSTLATAGAEVDSEARLWLDGSQPLEEDILKRLHARLAASAAVIERASVEAEG